MATITEDFVSFKTVKLLKEKGFSERTVYGYIKSKDTVTDCCYCTIPGFPSDYDYNNVEMTEHYVCAKPTLQMAMKWLKIKHSIHIESFCPVVDTTDEPVKYNVVISDLRNYCLAFNTPLEDKEFDSYEKACEVAIKYCLENLVY